MGPIPRQRLDGRAVEVVLPLQRERGRGCWREREAALGLAVRAGDGVYGLGLHGDGDHPGVDGDILSHLFRARHLETMHG